MRKNSSLLNLLKDIWENDVLFAAQNLKIRIHQTLVPFDNFSLAFYFKGLVYKILVIYPLVSL